MKCNYLKTGNCYLAKKKKKGFLSYKSHVKVNAFGGSLVIGSWDAY